MIDAIKANARLVAGELGKLYDCEFGYSQEAVVQVEFFIESQRSREDLDEDRIDDLVSALGSWLGECIISCWGGEWREADGNWGIFFDSKNAAFPLAKVRKQFEDGAESGEGIVGFFNAIPALFGRSGEIRP